MKCFVKLTNIASAVPSFWRLPARHSLLVGIGTRLDGTSLRIGVSLSHALSCRVSVPQYMHHTRVSVACMSTSPVFMTSHVTSPLVDIYDTTSSATSSSELQLQLQPMPRRCWSAILYGATLIVQVRRQLTSWRFDGAAWANGRCMVCDFTCPDTLGTCSQLDRSVYYSPACSERGLKSKSSLMK